MKKLLALVLCLGLVAGCSSTGTTDTSSTVKVGVGSVTSFKVADASTEKDGQVQVNTTVAAVGLDKDGVITYVSIDVAQNSGKVDTAGVVTTSEVTKTKKEKGADYGMAKASAIGKEWFEQVAVFEEYAIGKTLDEVKAIEITEGKFSDEELSSSVTVTVTEWLSALEKAVANAETVENVAEIGFGSYTTTKGTNATDEKAGAFQSNVIYGVWALDADGNVAFTQMDTAQNSGKVNVDGTVEAAAATKTKGEKGAEYGMAKVSTIPAEWDVQIVALADWMVGQSTQDILAAELDDTGVTADEDLKTSVTIKLNDYLSALDRAVSNLVEVK